MTITHVQQSFPKQSSIEQESCSSQTFRVVTIWATKNRSLGQGEAFKGAGTAFVIQKLHFPFAAGNNTSMSTIMLGSDRFWNVETAFGVENFLKRKSFVRQSTKTTLNSSRFLNSRLCKRISRFKSCHVQKVVNLEALPRKIELPGPQLDQWCDCMPNQSS